MKQIQYKDGRAYLFAEIGSEVEVKDKLLDGTFDIVYRDKRLFSYQQRKFYYSLIGEINKWSGQGLEEIDKHFKLRHFFVERGKLFSFNDTSDNTVEEANFLIDGVIEFVLKYDVPTKKEIWKDNTSQNFVYKCMMYRKCCVCGKHADVHHVDTIGMGMDRTKVSHVGREALPLCGGKHHKEIHTIGLEEFKEKYHVVPIKITREIVEKLKIRGIEIEEE